MIIIIRKSSKSPLKTIKRTSNWKIYVTGNYTNGFYLSNNYDRFSLLFFYKAKFHPNCTNNPFLIRVCRNLFSKSSYNYIAQQTLLNQCYLFMLCKKFITKIWKEQFCSVSWFLYVYLDECFITLLFYYVYNILIVNE